MPSFGNIDDMTLRRLGRTRKSSAIVLDNENQLQERNASKVSGNIITIYSLVLLSSLPGTFVSPRTSIDKSIAYLSVEINTLMEF